MSNNNNDKVNPWDVRELGVLWKRTKKESNENYLVGTINLKNLIAQNVDLSQPIQVVVFSNKSKKEEKHPDLRVYVSEKREETNNKPQAAKAPAAAQSKAKSASKQVVAPTSAADDDLI